MPARPVLADPLVLASHQLGTGLQARDRPGHVAPLLGRDQEVERPLGLDLGIAVAAHGPGGIVVAGDPPVCIKHDHDGPDRIEDGRHEVLLVDQLVALDVE